MPKFRVSWESGSVEIEAADDGAACDDATMHVDFTAEQIDDDEEDEEEEEDKG